MLVHARVYDERFDHLIIYLSFFLYNKEKEMKLGDPQHEENT